MLGATLVGLLGLLSSVSDAAPAIRAVEPRQTLALKSYLKKDYYTQWPSGGKKSFKFYVSSQIAAPDGHEREVLVITEQDPAAGPVEVRIPGPTIEANWGDTVEVEVVNRLEGTGTGIHFHGERQFHTNEMDGTPSITQCPLAPGESIKYIWTATQFGTSWYHSHFGVQAWDGVFGPIVIRHPESDEADVEIEPIMLSDWVHSSMEEHYKEHSAYFGTTLDNILINGKNVLPGDETKGKRHEVVFQEGKTHRLRFINTAVDSTFRVSIDNHEMQVIAADFVPIKPYTTKSITLTMGQRYDVLVKADQKAKDYWFRAEPIGILCQSSSSHVSPNNGRAIVRYDTKSDSTPETETELEEVSLCHDEDAKNLVPALEKSVDLDEMKKSKKIQWNFAYQDGRAKWNVEMDGNTEDQKSFFSDWKQPTLQQYIDKDTSHVQKTHTIEVDESDKWLKIVITNSAGTSHPIHLHGHDFYILEQSATAYDPDKENLNTSNPPRRDVVNLHGNGYLVLAMETDNPGAWLMHCHIGFHAAAGMNLQIAESMNKAIGLISEEKKKLMKDTCEKWADFQDRAGLDQEEMWESGP